MNNHSAADLGARIQGTSYSVGIVSGLKKAVGLLKKKAGDFYALEDDSLVQPFRIAAKLLEEELQLYQRLADREAIREEQAFRELDAIDQQLKGGE